MGDWVRFCLMLGLAGGALVVVVAYLTARMLIRPPRMRNGKAAWVLKRLSPGDFGLAYEEVSYVVRDEHSGQPLRLAGWWIPHPNATGRCILLVHGYADAKVGAIAWAPTFHSLGWNILAIDLRAHGESEGTQVTAGFFEQHDLNQIINELRAQRPTETRCLALFGASMGAAVVASAAVRRDDLFAVILESPSGDEEHATTAHLEVTGMPAGLTRRLTYWFMQWLTGARLADVRPIDLIERIPCPLMVVHPELDLYVPPEDAAAMQAAAARRSRPTVYWHVPGASHLMALSADPDDYRQRIGEFLNTRAGNESATQG